MKKFIMLLLCISLIACCAAYMVSCGDDEELCTVHTDNDENGMCDVCNVSMINPNAPSAVSVTFTVKDQDGIAVPSITLTFSAYGALDNEEPVTVTSGTDGKCTVKLKPAKYHVSADYDVETVGYYTLQTPEVKIESSTSAVDILMENNTPNGTESRPYTLSVGNNALSVPAGKSVYYILYRAVALVADVTASGVKIEYNGAEYTPDANNKINFAFIGEDFNSVANVKITNTGSQDASISFGINSVEGTLGNPHVISALGEQITNNEVAKGDTVYYSYTATKSGTLVLTVASADTSAAMQNNSYQVSTSSENSMTISLAVSAGDEVIINLTSSADENPELVFTVNLESAE